MISFGLVSTRIYRDEVYQLIDPCSVEFFFRYVLHLGVFGRHSKVEKNSALIIPPKQSNKNEC